MSTHRKSHAPEKPKKSSDKTSVPLRPKANTRDSTTSGKKTKTNPEEEKKQSSTTLSPKSTSKVPHTETTHHGKNPSVTQKVTETKTKETKPTKPTKPEGIGEKGELT